MNTINECDAIKKRLLNKKRREAFVSASVDQTIPFQIRAMRLAKDRNWTQQELASRSGMKQERISTCENPNYGRFSLQTLKQLASAFDVALIVRFAPFSELVEWESNLSPDSLEVKNFDKERDYFKDEDTEMSGLFLEKEYSQKATKQKPAESNVVSYLSDYKKNKPEELFPPNQPTSGMTARG